MKPRKLNIMGLNSFIEKETIDFSLLMEQGIFGIFGPTGSGKSTILDAITMALYDKIARNSKEFINKEAEAAEVSFTFSIQEGMAERRYLAQRRYKRAKDGGYRAAFARMLDVTDEEAPIVLAEKGSEVTGCVEAIIGLNYQDFVRSVVLPQGKFSEFLSLTGSDRRRMLERIFHLEQYGGQLTEKIKKALECAREKLQDTESRLSVYGILDEKIIAEKKEALTILQKELKRQREKLLAASEPLKKKRALYQICCELERWGEEQAKLEKQRDSIEQERTKQRQGAAAREVRRYEQVWQRTQAELETARENWDRIKKELQELEIAADNSKARYEEAQKQKKEGYPCALQAVEGFKQAVQLQEEKERYEKERQALLSQYKEEHKILQQKKLRSNQLLSAFTEAEAQETVRRERKKAVTISREYRQEITAAMQQEQRMQELEKQLEKQAELVEKWHTQIQSLLEEESVKKKEQENILILLKREKAAQQALLEKQAALKDEEVTRSHNSILWEQELEQAKLTQGQITMLQEEEQKLTECIQKLLEEQEAEKQSVLAAEKKEQELAKQVAAWEQESFAGILAAVLQENEPCPVCGSLCHPNPAKRIQDALTDTAKEEQETIQQQLAQRKKCLQEKALFLERKKSECNAKKEQRKKLEDTLKGKTLEAMEARLVKVKKDISDGQQAFDGIKKAIAQKESCIAVTEQKKQQLLEAVAKNIEKRSGIMERCKEEEKEQEENQKELAIIKKAIRRLQEKYPLAHSFTEEQVRIDTCDQIREELEQEEKTAQEKLERIKQEREEIEGQIQKLQGNLIAIETTGKEKKNAADERRDKITALVGGNNPKILLAEKQAEIARLLEEEERASASLKQAAEKQQQEAVQQGQAEQEVKTKEILCRQQKNSYFEILQKQGFATEKDYQSSVLTEEQILECEKRVAVYEKKDAEVRANYNRLTEQAGGQRVQEEEILEWEKNVQSLTGMVEQLSQQDAVQKQALLEAEKKLQAIKQLERLQRDQGKKYDMLADLAKVLKGNKFIDFISGKELSYITKEASQRLMRMTRGRYGIFMAEGEFSICDQFHGGTIRKTNTLSGGETFLTSLALALALSSKIQMKNRAPLQFFFLDEGFGTLDEALLDVVMGALEELKKEQLSVGVISHVEEMKERIPIKLVVEPAAFGRCGTTTHLEYN